VPDPGLNELANCCDTEDDPPALTRVVAGSTDVERTVPPKGVENEQPSHAAVSARNFPTKEPPRDAKRSAMFGRGCDRARPNDFCPILGRSNNGIDSEAGIDGAWPSSLDDDLKRAEIRCMRHLKTVSPNLLGNGLASIWPVEGSR
jgi:hypothetical protein